MCDQIVPYYTERDVYGNGYILTTKEIYYDDILLGKGCTSLTPTEQFNVFCQTPSISGELASACETLLDAEQDDPALVYNQFLTELVPAEQQIYPAGYVNGPLSGALELAAIHIRAGKDTRAYVAASNGAYSLFVAVGDQQGYAPFGQGVTGLAVDGNGVVYYGTSTQIVRWEVNVGSTVEVDLKGVADAGIIGSIAVSPNGRNLMWVEFARPVGVDTRVSLRSTDEFGEQTFYPDLIESIDNGTTPILAPELTDTTVTEGVAVSDDGAVFFCNYSADVENFASQGYFCFMSDIRPTSSGQQAQVRIHSTAIFSKRFFQKFNEFSRLYYTFQSDPSASIIKYVVVGGNPLQILGDVLTLDAPPLRALDVDAVNEVLYVLTKNTSTLILYNMFSPYASRELFNYTGTTNNPLMQDLANMWSTSSIQVFLATQQFGDNVLRMFDENQTFSLVSDWSEAGLPLFLCDNGDIVVIQGGLITSRANIGDGTRSTEAEVRAGAFTPFDLSGMVEDDTRQFVSLNGLYRLEVIKRSPTANLRFIIQLYNNVSNEVGLNSFCIEGDTRRQSCLERYEDYLVRTPEDPRNFCYDNAEAILMSVYGETQLAVIRDTQPVVYTQLLDVAPCLSAQCRSYFTEDSLMSTYLETFSCPTDLVICTNILEQADNINGSVVQATSCDTPNFLPCSNGCPIGTICDATDNLCRIVCQSSTECKAGDQCAGGLCQSGLEDPPPLLPASTTLILMVTVGLLVAILVWIGITYRKPKK